MPGPIYNIIMITICMVLYEYRHTVYDFDILCISRVRLICRNLVSCTLKYLLPLLLTSTYRWRRLREQTCPHSAWKGWLLAGRRALTPNLLCGRSSTSHAPNTRTQLAGRHLARGT